MVFGLLFSQGDFEEALRIIALCGLDADTTASQVGALMGVIVGASGIPAKWKEPLDDRLEMYVEGFERLRILKMVDKTIKANRSFSKI